MTRQEERAHEAAVEKLMRDQRDKVARIEIQRGLENIGLLIEGDGARAKLGIEWCLEDAGGKRRADSMLSRLAGLAVALGIESPRTLATRCRLSVRLVQQRAKEAREVFRI